jgi:hypothetical protein
MHFFFSDLSTLHNDIAGDILPSELIGEGYPLNPTSWAKTMLTPTDVSFSQLIL